MRKKPTGTFNNRGVFKNLVEILNANVSRILYRRSLVDYAYKDDTSLVPLGSLRVPCTVDKWRRQLEVLGYLERLAPGKYYVMREIPDELDTTNLEKLYSESLDEFYKEHK